MELPNLTHVIDAARSAQSSFASLKPETSAELSKDFEVVFATHFVDQMMKTLPASAFGGEQQADMWRSFMSEAVAKALVEQGGLGFAAPVQDLIGAYQAAGELSAQKPQKG